MPVAARYSSVIFSPYDMNCLRDPIQKQKQKQKQKSVTWISTALTQAWYQFNGGFEHAGARRALDMSVVRAPRDYGVQREIKARNITCLNQAQGAGGGLGKGVRMD